MLKDQCRAAHRIRPPYRMEDRDVRRREAEKGTDPGDMIGRRSDVARPRRHKKANADSLK